MPDSRLPTRGDLGRDDQRSVESGSESGGQSIEGLSGREIGWIVAGIGEGESMEKNGSARLTRITKRGRPGHQGVTLDGATPSIPEPPGRGLSRALEESRNVEHCRWPGRRSPAWPGAR